MQAGPLRHRVTIETKGEERDEHGGVVETWFPVATVWASVQPLQGRELFLAQQVDARLSHRVTLRYQAEVTPTHRLVFKERALYPVEVQQVDERGRTTVILAMENL
jgi:SPP1 family predicted phage head-tail adaptor